MGLPIFKMATIGLLPSPLKKLYYRLNGAKIGKRVSLGLLSILNSKNIEIDDDSKIGVLSFINANKIKIGKRSKINSMVAIDTGNFAMKNDSIIMEQVVIGGMLTPNSNITIGNNVKIFPYSFLNPTEEIIIEDDVGVGGANYIFTHGSWQSKLDGFPISFGPVTIKKGVWLPWRVFIMPNVTINEYATIGAGSIITKDIPSYSLAAGSPAKVLRTKDEYIKSFSNDEKIKIIEEILQSFKEYLIYLEFPTNLTEDNEGIKLENDLFCLFFISSNNDISLFKKANKDLIIVSMDEISNEQKEALNESNIIWFDLHARETFFHRKKSWELTKDFFSRYGIRFYTYPD